MLRDLQGRSLSPKHPVLTWPCSQGEDWQRSLLSGARAGCPARKHFWKALLILCTAAQQEWAVSAGPLRLHLHYSKRAPSGAAGHMAYPTSRGGFVLDLAGTALTLQVSLGAGGLMQRERSLLGTPQAILAGSLSAQRVISWSWALRATLNSQCRHLTSSVIQFHLFTSSSFPLVDKKTFYIYAHLGHSSLLPSIWLHKTTHNIREGKADLP